MKNIKKSPPRRGNAKDGQKGNELMNKHIKRYTGRQEQKIIRIGGGVGAFLTFLLMLGTIGGIDKGTMAFKTGAWLLIGETVLFIVFLWLAGALTDWRRR